MRNVVLCVTLYSTCLLSCGKNIKTSDVFTSDLKVDTTSIDADGSSVDSLFIVLNSNASSDRRSVIFTASAGTLVNGTAGKLTVAADFVNGQLLAAAALKAPQSPGTITVTAAPATTSPNGDYTKTATITANKVVPATIHLETSAFGIAANFINTDTIVGTLKGPAHQKVSLGAQVLFEDVLASGAPAGGRFRNKVSGSDGNSQVSVLYSAPAVAIGTNIYIRVTVLTDAGAVTNISDVVTLTVNQ